MIPPLVNIIKEGAAKVNFPKDVFYNPVQEFNRDLTISVINVFNKYRTKNPPKSRNQNKGQVSGLKIFEALSATGLRSIRFALEIPNIEKIIANDIDPIASELITENVILNKVEHLVDVNCGDAKLFMYQQQATQSEFHVVDLDPYGSASPFLDAAVPTVKSGGLLCVTCTDAAVLCGAALGTSMGKYGSVTIGSKLASSHEQGIRILLHAIQSAASRYGRYIQPLLSLSIDFYFRVFVRIHDSPKIVKSIATRLGMLFCCVGCRTYHVQPLGVVEKTSKNSEKVQCANGPVVGTACDYCGGRFVIGGPLWIDSIHDREFCDELLAELSLHEHKPLATEKRIIGIVSLAREELSDVPLYYELDKLAATIRCITPSQLEIRSALLHAGFRVSTSHCAPSSIKTDASPAFLWRMLRTWFATKEPEKFARIIGGEVDSLSNYARRILSITDESQPDINFELHPDANPPSRALKLLRFQPNPAPNWGPKPKASRLDKE